jgi:hypothetical protein
MFDCQYILFMLLGLHYSFYQLLDEQCLTSRFFTNQYTFLILSSLLCSKWSVSNIRWFVSLHLSMFKRLSLERHRFHSTRNRRRELLSTAFRMSNSQCEWNKLFLITYRHARSFFRITQTMFYIFENNRSLSLRITTRFRFERNIETSIFRYLCNFRSHKSIMSCTKCQIVVVKLAQRAFSLVVLIRFVFWKS